MLQKIPCKNHEAERLISVPGGFRIADLDWPGIICSGKWEYLRGSGFQTAGDIGPIAGTLKIAGSPRSDSWKCHEKSQANHETSLKMPQKLSAYLSGAISGTGKWVSSPKFKDFGRKSQLH
jgi:hypothetical protein